MPDLFEGCTEAVGEVGGFSVTLPTGRRTYLVQTAEKGIAWMTVEAEGTEGHGSLPHPDNCVAALSRAMARVADHTWPTTLTPTIDTLFAQVAEETGARLDPDDVDGLHDVLGSIGRIVTATTRNTSNPTVLQAGQKTNQVPRRPVARSMVGSCPAVRRSFSPRSMGCWVSGCDASTRSSTSRWRPRSAGARSRRWCRR